MKPLVVDILNEELDHNLPNWLEEDRQYKQRQKIREWLAAKRAAKKAAFAFNPDQPRDEDGKWTAGAALLKAVGDLNTGSEVVSNLFDSNPDAPANLANEVGRDVSERELLAARNLLIQRTQAAWKDKPDTVVVYRGGPVRGEIVPVTTDRRVAERHARGGSVTEVTINKAAILADMDVVNGPSANWKEGELLVHRSSLSKAAFAFNPDQPRDEDGKWTDGGGGEHARIGGNTPEDKADKAMLGVLKAHATNYLRKELGFKGKIGFKNSGEVAFEVTGTNRTPDDWAADAYYDEDTRQIVVNTDFMLRSSSMLIEKTLVHEAYHADFHAAMRAEPGLEKDLAQYVRSNAQKLAEEGSKVSPYSKSIWANAASIAMDEMDRGQSVAPAWLLNYAVNESLAECAALRRVPPKTYIYIDDKIRKALRK